MTAAELLRDLEERDVRLALHGDRLQVDAPQGMITSELRQSLASHKPELVNLIRQRDSALSREDAITAMDLDEFARADIVLRVHSTVLDQEVLFASDSLYESTRNSADLPVYRASELRKLAILQPEPHSLRYLHEVKTIFNGTITDVRARDDHRHSA